MAVLESCEIECTATPVHTLDLSPRVDVMLFSRFASGGFGITYMYDITTDVYICTGYTGLEAL